MNPNQPSREQIEARITALLLGDLPADEAELLRWTISRDPELQKLHGRLLLTVGLVREVVGHPEEASAEKAVSRQLSDERRQKLLAHFKTPRPAPKPLFWLKRIEVRPLVTALALVAVLAVLAAMLLPALAAAKRKGGSVTMMAGRVVESEKITAATVAAARGSGNQASISDFQDKERPVASWSANLAAATPPPAPALTPPPTEIVLPKSEPAPVANGNYYYNFPNGDADISAVPSTQPSDSFAAGNAGVVNTPVESLRKLPRPALPAASPPAVVMAPVPAATETGVTAPKSDVTGLTDELDIPSARDQAVATVQLQNSDPQQVAQTLQNMFRNGNASRGAAGSSQNSALQQRAQNGVTTLGTTIASSGIGGVSGVGGGGGGGFGGGGSGRGGGGFGGGSGNIQNAGTVGSASIGVDPNTHNLVVVADAETQDQIKGVISQLDKPSAQRLVENASAGRIDSFDLAEPSALPATPSSGTTFAWNDNTLDRSGTENQAGDAWQSGALLGRNATTGIGQTDATRRVSSAAGAGEDALRNKDQVASAQNFYRISGGDTSQEKSTTLGDSQLMGGLFQSSSRVAGTVVSPPPAAAPVELLEAGFANSAVSEKTVRLGLTVPGYTPSTDAGPARSRGGNQMVQLEGAWSPNSAVVSPPPPASAPAQPQPEISYTLTRMGNMAESPPSKPESGNSTLAFRDGNTSSHIAGVVANDVTLTTIGGTLLNGHNSLAGELAGNLGEAKKEAGDQGAWSLDSKVKGFYDNNYATGATRDDVSGNLMGFTTAYIAEPSTSASASPTLTQQQLQKNNDWSEAGRQSYLEAIRKLDNSIELHKLLAAKISSENLDLSIPKSSMVTIVDQAQPTQSQNLWQNLTGKVESKVRIEFNPDVADITGLSGVPAETSDHFDPYFVQTTIETIKSDAVLGKVVDALKLDETWSKKNGGERLSKEAAIALLKKRLDLKPEKNSKLFEIGATSDKPDEAAKIANAVAQAYQDYRLEKRGQLTLAGVKTLQEEFVKEEEQIRLAQAEVDRLAKEANVAQSDQPLPRPAATNAPIPQPEFLTRENAFSTFSMNVSDVSFKLAQASLQKGQMPVAASIRSEEFINAFNYRDPEAATGQPLAFASEQARDPFAQNRDFLRFSVKTAAAGRQAGRALNLVLLLDTSGSMERADRVAIIREALRVLASQLQPQDTVSVVTFARTARLWADGVSGDKAGATLDQVGGITPDGGTNLEEAMRLAYETAHRHYLAQGANRVVLLTDGAANLGNVDPNALKASVEAQRRQGIALDCFGIGWEDFNDDLLEQLSGNGDGRYAFINSPEEAGTDFAAKLAGALQVAAQDVKVQVEFNPQRVVSWRQIGYAKHQLTKEQFRDNSVLAAEIAAQEAGNALYTVETKPDGAGPIATVYVRYRIPGTQDVRERSWTVDGDGAVPALDQSSAAMRLATVAAEFSEWLAASPFAQEVTPDELLNDLSGVPQIYGADQRPAQLETMIREARSVSGK